MVAHIGVEKEDMNGSNPDTIDETDKKTMQEIPFAAIFCNKISAEYKNDHPEYRFNFHPKPEYRGKCHCQPKKRQKENQFPFHTRLVLKVLFIFLEII
jgi:hypothetical protein